MRLNEWRDSIYRWSVSKGWWDVDDPTSTVHISSKIALMHSELSEALEELRDGNREVYHVRDKNGHDKLEGLPIEFADVIIRILDTCGALGIDIEYALSEKHAYNQTRSHKHGGKEI